MTTILAKPEDFVLKREGGYNNTCA